MNFKDTNFGPESPSMFIIEARGRLGNHLMAFTTIMALQKAIGIQAYFMFTSFFFHYVSLVDL